MINLASRFLTRGILVFTLALGLANANAAMEMDSDPSQGHEETLLQVTTDTMGGATIIKLFVDGDSNIQALREYTADGKVKEFTPQQLASGAVLMESDGREVIKLFFRKVDLHSGGRVDLVYLTNGLFNSHATLQMRANRLPNGWTLEVNDRRGRRNISTMVVYGKKWFGRLVGIDRIEAN